MSYSRPTGAEAISSKGGAISCLLPYPDDIGRKDIKVHMIFTLGMWGTDFGYGEQVMPGNPDDYEFSKKMYAVAQALFDEGKVRRRTSWLDEICSSRETC